MMPFQNIVCLWVDLGGEDLIIREKEDIITGKRETGC